MTFNYTSSSLPIAYASIVKKPSPAGYLASTGTHNITKAQEELLPWYSILGHYNIQNTQQLMTASGVDTEPILRPKETGTNTCFPPLCTACLRGKGTSTHMNQDNMYNPNYGDTLKDGDLLPGQTISTDQYECRVKGRLPNSRG